MARDLIYVKVDLKYIVMKKTYLHIPFLILCYIQGLVSQPMFQEVNMDADFYQKISNYPSMDIDHIKSKTVFFNFNQILHDSIYNNVIQQFKTSLPFINGSELDVELEYFSVFSNDFLVNRHTPYGHITDNYQPSIKTYKIINSLIQGVLIFSKKDVKGILKIGEDIYQIDVYDTEKKIYFLINTNDSPISFPFHCSTDQLEVSHNITPNSHRVGSGFLGC